MTQEDGADLIDEVADEAAQQIMAELAERGFLAKTTTRYEDELQATIAAIIGVAIDENLVLVGEEDDEEIEEEDDVEQEH